MIRLKGLRTSNSPGMPASTAFAALVGQRAVSVLVFPSDNTETEESLHMYRIPGTAARVQACVGDTGEVEQGETNLSNPGRRSTRSRQALVIACFAAERVQ